MLLVIVGDGNATDNTHALLTRGMQVVKVGRIFAAIWILAKVVQLLKSIQIPAFQKTIRF